MERQVIQNFLNLPGMAGVALMDGQNQPFFYWPNLGFSPSQSDSLAERIQQIVETTPTPGETFAFRFTNQLVYVYRLKSSLILLVAMAESLSLQGYREAVGQLQTALIADPENAVATFKAVVSSLAFLPQVGAVVPGTEELGAVSDLSAEGLSLDGRQVVAALNHLSDRAAQYLGKTMVVNTWKVSRPNQPWLQQFELQKSGHFLDPAIPQGTLTSEQQQWLQAWVSTFLERGGKTIRNFSALVADNALSPSEKALLLGNSANATGD